MITCAGEGWRTDGKPEDPEDGRVLALRVIDLPKRSRTEVSDGLQWSYDDHLNSLMEILRWPFWPEL